jgi:hypothetical protein
VRINPVAAIYFAKRCQSNRSTQQSGRGRHAVGWYCFVPLVNEGNLEQPNIVASRWFADLATKQATILR